MGEAELKQKNEELKEKNEELQKELEELQDYVLEIGEELEKEKEKNKNLPSDSGDLSIENEDLHTKLDNKEAEVRKLHDDLGTANAKLAAITDEKKESDKKANDFKERIKTLEKEVSHLTSEVTKSKQSSHSVLDQNKKNFQQAQLSAQENARLVDDIKDLEEKLSISQHEMNELAALYEALDEEKDMIEIQCEKYHQDFLDAQEATKEMSSELEKVKNDLEEALNTEDAYRTDNITLKAEMAELTDKLKTATDTSNKKIAALQKEISVLKDSTQVGEKQITIDKLEKEIALNHGMIEELSKELEKSHADNKLLAEQVAEDGSHINAKASSLVSLEQTKTKQLEVTIERLKTQNAENIAYYEETERERDDLSNRVDELEHWKSVYEANHGLQELARNQKRLKDDNRRLSVAVEQLSGNIDMLRNTNNVLTLSFDKLKKEAGKPADFQYDQYALQIEVQSINNNLKAQVTELEQQVIALEKENTRIRIAMKNQAGSISEAGFKFAGMTADQLIKVNDFAVNLREGKIDLPLDDQSRVLSKENKALKDELTTVRTQMQRYERELGGAIPYPASGQDAAGMSGSERNPMMSTNSDFDQIKQDNKELHLKLNSLQNELLNLIKGTVSHAADKEGLVSSAGVSTAGMISAHDLSTILSQNNELMLKELQQLRNVGTAEHHATQNQCNQLAFIQQQQQFLSQQTAQQQSQGYPVLNRYNERPPSGKQTGAPRPGTAGSSTPGPKLMLNTAPHAINTPAGMQPSSNLWTPMMGRGGMPFDLNGTPYGGPSLNGPNTPHGKQLLSKTLTQMNLPPEEWAGDIAELNSTLIEALEQLYERETELEDTRHVVANLETSLVSIKQQMAALYYDYSQHSDVWEEREKKYKAEALQLNHERDDLKLKISRLAELHEIMQSEDRTLIEQKLIETTRKCTIYEVNESILSRKYIAQAEQLTVCEKAKQALQGDFIEMEAALKKRILYLEQYKLSNSARLSHLQGKLDSSVAADDYLQLQLELENLRDDHLSTLRREVEARIVALKNTDNSRELRYLKLELLHNQVELAGNHDAILHLEAELLHQKEATERAIKAVQSTKSNDEVVTIISEMARFRGEASRLEVELLAANRRSELLVDRVSSLSAELESSAVRITELEARDIENTAEESESRKKLLEIQLTYEGGLTKLAAEDLKTQHDKYRLEVEEAKRDVVRYKELAEIATQQATSLSGFKKQGVEEVQELRAYCARLESRTEDELLIGKLQRELMSTKATYKTFVKKYTYTREQLRVKEMALRVLEARVDEQEKALGSLQDRDALEIAALKKALRNMKNTVVEEPHNNSNNNSSKNSAGGGGVVATVNTSQNNSINNKKAAKKTKNNAAATHGIITVSIGQKLLDMSVKVDELSALAEDAVLRAAEAEKKSLILAGKNEDLEAEKSILETKNSDLLAIKNQTATQKELGLRFSNLLDELKDTKLLSLDSRRKIQTLTQEKHHLQSLISNIEADVHELESDKVKIETDNLLLHLKPLDHIGNNNNNNTNHNNSNSNRNGGNLFGSDSVDSEDFTHDNNTNNPATTKHNNNNASNNATKNKKAKQSVDKLNLVIDDLDMQEHTPVTNEELLQKLKTLRNELMEREKDISEKQIAISNMSTSYAELRELCVEKENNIQYYEQILRRENRNDLLLQGNAPHSARPITPRQSSHHNAQMQAEQQEAIQIAATATIKSLREIVEEKERLLEKYRMKIEFLQSNGISPSHKSRADIRADELLERYALEDRINGKYNHNLHSKLTHQSDNDDDNPSMHEKLLSQLQESESILAEKHGTIEALERKLYQTENKCSTAETRCGEALQEIENMKADMLTLVERLHDAEDKNVHMQHATHGSVRKAPLSPRPPATPLAGTTDPLPMVDAATDRKLSQLELANKSMKTKVQGYRNIIIKLKEEFIKTEQEKAELQVLANKTGDHRSGSTLNRGSNRDGPRGTSSDDAPTADEMRSAMTKLRKFKEQVGDLEDSVKKLSHKCADLTEKNEKLKKQSEDIGEERTKWAADREKLEKNNDLQQKSLNTLRAKEVKLRDMIDKLKNGDGKGGLTLPQARDQIATLQRDLDIANAQLLALKQNDSHLTHHNTGHHSGIPTRSVTPNSAVRGVNEAKEGTPPRTGGYVLGGGDGSAVDESRKLVASRWEKEKKLEEQNTTLKARLKEKMTENDELKEMVQRLKRNVDSAQAAKDNETKRANTAAKQNADGRKATVEDISELEKAQENVFALQQELARVSRIAEVDRMNEITHLNHLVTKLRGEINELRAEVAESESRRKEALSGPGTVRSQLREEEDRYHKEARLKDLLEQAKQQKADAESQLLERDAAYVMMRFDVNANEDKVDNLNRRIAEYAAEVKQLKKLLSESYGESGVNASNKRTFAATSEGYSGVVTQSGVRSKKETDLERTIDTMSRAMEKLKTENDRLKKTPIDTQKMGDFEKKLQFEHQKVLKYEAEIAQLSAKVTAKDDLSQKMAQKELNITALKKQLKAKGDECRSKDEMRVQLEDEKATFLHRISRLEGENQKLQVALQTAESSRAPTGPMPKQEAQSMQAKDRETRAQLEQLLTQNEALKSQLQDARKIIQQQSTGANSGSGNNRTGATASGSTSSAEMQRIQDENARLRAELSAFDSDFFNEIEEMKYQYSEAKKRLAMFESGAIPSGAYNSNVAGNRRGGGYAF